MFATSDGTSRYTDRFPAFRDAAFYRSVMGLEIASLGIGTYLGGLDDAADAAYTDALVAAGEGGINLFDCAINYRQQRSERCIGAALQRLQRDEIVVCTKAGFLTPGAVPASLKPERVVGGMHSMDPDFLADQIERSLANLGVDTIDVFYLHNPETQLGFLTREEFDMRLAQAFSLLEEMVERGKLRWYGAATWDGLRQKGALSLSRMVELAAQTGGPTHHFRFIQLPFNVEMVEAFVEKPESVLDAALRLGVTAVASATLSQTRVLEHMPERLADRLPDTATNAQRAIQFTRSTPGIASALVGMSRRAHVVENLGVARVAPIARDEYVRLYQ
jgi:aryl-alcohol dehydrogenase-like predicted oxidoreductase